MGPLNFEFGKRKEAPTDGAGNDWDTIGAEVPFQQEQNRERANMERQQRKIIASMMYDIRYLDEPDVNLPQGVEEDFVEKLGRGEIDEGAQKAFLKKISGPMQQKGAAAVNWELGTNKHFRRILGYALAGGAGFIDYGSMMNERVVSDFGVLFPTPMDFEKTRDKLLDGIREGSGEAKYREYAEDLEKFQQTVYGKRYEYYKSLLDLKGKSKQTESRTEYETGETRDYLDAEKEQILKHSIVDGDDFLYRGQKYKLTPDILRNMGLSPERKMMLGKMEIGLSPCFDVRGRDTILGYVKTDDGYKVRSYYRSNSQGMWRYLPDYVTDGGEDDGILWYGKGYTEEMTTLPCEMQKELSALATEKRTAVEQKTVPSFIFAGTAKAYPSKEAYAQAAHHHALRGDVYKEISSVPDVDFGRISDHKQPPESVRFDGPISPNYNKELMSWESDTGIYGHLISHVFQSHDGRLKYTISEDIYGRCFVSNIETNAVPTSCGVRSRWVSGGDIETPLYEYERMSNGYGDSMDRRDGGRYVGMWKGYVSKLKIIQDYMAAKKY